MKRRLLLALPALLTPLVGYAQTPYPTKTVRLMVGANAGGGTDIVARLLSGEPASVTTLAQRYDMSFAAVQKHVAVLEEAGLVSKESRGRERIVRSNPERIAQARALLLQLEQLWISRFSQLDDVLATPHRPKE